MIIMFTFKRHVTTTITVLEICQANYVQEIMMMMKSIVVCQINILTKFHKDWMKTVASIVYTRWPKYNPNPDFIKTNILTKFHEDWMKNINLLTKVHKDWMKNINILTKFHKDWMKTATSIVYTREHPRIDRIVMRDVQFQMEVNQCRNEEVNFQVLIDGRTDGQTDKRTAEITTISPRFSKSVGTIKHP
ncbi:hypothetical protein DPMN_027743 [Dreissena polymorpha]|uniref:Uncharacterized protein n=1 Tax=Dreissena polymorpha TaxID=45954 RepID=A0A9D4LVW0_DREPO|nr:hypothetical protein DPMN_027743 [Dreissena polymorpha]